MAFFFTLLLFAASLVISEFLTPKPNIENARPAGLGDFQSPTATQGRAVPLIWGTVLLKGLNVTWHGDLVQIAITEKIKTGLFSSERVTTGFRYKIGIQMAVCRGRDADVTGEVEFLRVFIGEEEFSNDDGSNPLGSGVSEATVLFDNADFFGGIDKGDGGIVGNVTFRPGSRTQLIPDYLRIHQQLTGGKTPRYTGTAFALAEQVEIGTRTQIDPWWFENRRMPNPLSLGANTVNAGMDLNPMSALAEVLVNDDWGFKFPLSDINSGNFSAAAAVLNAEGNGFSYVLDRTVAASDLVQQVERQIDGVLFLNRITGEWEINLARPTDVPVLALDDNNVLEVRQFTRGLFTNTSNEVLTEFQSRDREYEDDYGRAQDLGNIQQRGGAVVTETVNYTGCKDPALAQQLADRDLVTFSYPIAKATLVVNREAWALNPSDVVTWSNTPLGINAFEFRVIRIDFGEALDGKITLDIVENIFAIGQAAFGAPDSGSWTPPVSILEAYNADTPPQAIMFEAPRAFVQRDPFLPTLFPRVWFGLRSKGDGGITYDLEDTSAQVLATAAAFFVQGQLAGNLAASGLASVTFNINAGESTLAEIRAQLEDVSASDVGDQLSQLILIGDEFIGVESITDLITSIRVDVGYRGFLDSVPTAHSATDPVYLIFVGGSLGDGKYDGGTRRLITEGLNGVRLAPASAFSATPGIVNRFNQPYSPARLSWNGSDFGTSFDFGSSETGVPFDGRGVRLDFVRRDFRIANEVDKHVDESSLPSDFPGANTTEYRVQRDPNVGVTQVGVWAAASAAFLVFSRAEEIWLFDENPTLIDWTFEVRHTVNSVVIQGRSILHQTTPLGTQINKGYLGRMDDTVIRSFTAPETGSYGFDIGADLLNGGIVEAQINGGGFATVISAAGSSGTLAGVTSGDTVDVRHTGVNGNAVFALLIIDPPTATGFVAPLRI